jgi:hypothetical protein
MKSKPYLAIGLAGALFLSGCASQMLSDLNNAFDNPTRAASNERSTVVLQQPYTSPMFGPSGDRPGTNPPANYPNPYAANIGPSLR